VADLVEGIYRLMMSDIHDPVNIGNPDERTILELADPILRITGSKSRIVFRPLPVNDPKVRQPDIGKAREALDWSPRMDLEDGLKVTIAWFIKRLGMDGGQGAS